MFSFRECNSALCSAFKYTLLPLFFLVAVCCNATWSSPLLEWPTQYSQRVSHINGAQPLQKVAQSPTWWHQLLHIIVRFGKNSKKLTVVNRSPYLHRYIFSNRPSGADWRSRTHHMPSDQAGAHCSGTGSATQHVSYFWFCHCTQPSDYTQW